MRSRLPLLSRMIVWLAVVVILKVTAEIVLRYVHYFPPNLHSDFLWGRASYFFTTYQWAFYAHILSGPVTLLLGLLLLSERFRQRAPHWHRRLGRIQVATILGVLVPSGVWMAQYAIGGRSAMWAFNVLSLATGWCVVCGWRAALMRRFVSHRQWMWRSYVLLCSAVVLRLLGGIATWAEWPSAWFDSVAAWVSWLVPWAALEVSWWAQRHLLTAASSREPLEPEPQAVVHR